MTKRLLALFMAGMAAINAYATFPTATLTATIDATVQPSAGWDDFGWQMNGNTDYALTWTVTGLGSLTGYKAQFKMSKIVGDEKVVYLVRTNTQVTVSGSNITCSVAATNVPPDDSYMAEVMLTDSTGLSSFRSIGRGSIRTVDSLFDDDDGTYTFPDDVDPDNYTTLAAFTSHTALTTTAHGGIATSTQGSKADSAVQVVTPSTGINVTTSGTERVVSVTAAIASGAAAGATASQPGHTQPWASITNPPATYAPSAHNQPANTITNLTDVVLPLAGGTVTGPLLTTRDFTATAPASDEFPSAEWVRSLAMQGAEWFLSGTATNWSGRKTTNFVAMQSTNPAQLTNTVASPIPSSTYILGGITTNTYGSLRSPVTFEIFANRNGGNVTTTIPLHPELYYVYANGSTNHLGDWEAANQNITATTPTRYTYTVAFTEPTITGAVRIVAYIKSGTVSGTAAGLRFYGGGIYPSHLNIDGVPAGETAADVADDLLAHETSGTHPASAITNLLSVAQPLDADLTRLAGNDGSSLVYPTNITTVAAGATGTSSVYLVAGYVNHVRMLATGTCTLKVWMPATAGSVRSYSRVSIYNPNLKPVIWGSAAGGIYWPSNGTYTATARSVNKFGVVQIMTGTSAHEAILVATNATELFYP